MQAQPDIEDVGQVDESGLAHAVGRDAAGWLDPRTGDHVHDGTPSPAAACEAPATAWLSQSAGPRLMSIISSSISGVVLSASPGRNVPMVFTSTSGPDLAVDPVDEAFRRGGVGGIGHLAADANGEFTRRLLVPFDRHHRQAADGQGRRRRLTKPAACTGHDRYLALTASPLDLGTFVPGRASLHNGPRLSPRQVKGRRRS